MIEDNINIKIERYLGSSMSQEEEIAFEQDLLLDNELREKVNLSRSINHHLNQKSWESIETSSDHKNELQAYFNSEEAKELKQKLKKIQQRYNEPRQRSFLKYIVAAASVLLVVTVSYFSLKQKSYEELYVEFYTKKDLPSFVTRGNDKGTLRTGIIAFEANNYNEALKTFDDYMTNSNFVNPWLYIYKGMSHMELNEFNKAIQSFDQLINSNSIDRSKGLWYKCLVYLKMNDSLNLKMTLHEILKNPSNYNYEKSQKLLDNL